MPEVPQVEGLSLDGNLQLLLNHWSGDDAPKIAQLGRQSQSLFFRRRGSVKLRLNESPHVRTFVNEILN
jgi:hypothetical protein